MTTTLDRALAEWRRLMPAEQRDLITSMNRIIRRARSLPDSGSSENVVAWEAALALLEAAL